MPDDVEVDSKLNGSPLNLFKMKLKKAVLATVDPTIVATIKMNHSTSSWNRKLQANETAIHEPKNIKYSVA